MGDQPKEQRLFNEKDVSRILKRATELQAGRGEADAYGLTLAELQQIAREAGISPEAVAAAAAEVGAQPEARPGFQPLGGPIAFSRERVVAGEVSEETWEAMLDEIRKTYNLVGTSSKVGRSLEWTFTERVEQAQVTVTARDGRVKLRVAHRYPKQALLTFLPALWTATIFFGLIMGGSVGWPVAVALFTAVLVVARFAFAALTRRKEQKAAQLLGRLERLVVPPAAAAAAAASTVAAEPAEAGRLPLPDAGAPQDEAEADRLRTARRARG